MFLSTSEISSRLISDLRLGLPIILNDVEQFFLVAAIETLYSEKLKKINEITENVKFEIAITNRRAKVLKARIYNGSVTRLSIKEHISVQLLHPIQNLKQHYSTFDVLYSLHKELPQHLVLLMENAA